MTGRGPGSDQVATYCQPSAQGQDPVATDALPGERRRVGPPVALTIAGSDSGGGAGIQADLVTFAAHGVFGTSVITAVTAQNTAGVFGVHVVAPDFVDAQLSAVLSDLGVAAVKTGMLATAANIEVVARRARAGELANLVVDPVMVASSGDRLLDADAETAYLRLLFPHALVVTPNLREASILVGRTLGDVAEMRGAAAQLAATGARYVLIKGGHLHGDAVDVLFDGHRAIELRSARVATPNVHGTGCTLASAIAARLACGSGVPEAVEVAKAYVSAGLAGARNWRLGSGHGPIDHLGWEDSRSGLVEDGPLPYPPREGLSVGARLRGRSAASASGDTDARRGDA